MHLLLGLHQLDGLVVAERAFGNLDDQQNVVGPRRAPPVGVRAQQGQIGLGDRVDSKPSGPLNPDQRAIADTGDETLVEVGDDHPLEFVGREFAGALDFDRHDESPLRVYDC